MIFKINLKLWFINKITLNELTWVQNFLSFWVASTEWAIKLKMVYIVQERWANGEQYILKQI